MYKIDFYEDSDGYSEIETFIFDLDSSNQKSDGILLRKILHQFDLLKTLGPNLREPQTKFLKGYRHPLMELRPFPERIFYAAWQADRFVILHHYTKRSNKTDIREINKALNNLDDWLKRKGLL